MDAVIHNLTVIGEAAHHIPAEITGRHADIPWRQMIDMRNFSVHAYWNLRPFHEKVSIVKPDVAGSGARRRPI